MQSFSALRNLRTSGLPALTQARGYARATLVGRLAGSPTKRETSAGKPYYTYLLAVNQPPKRDASGNVQMGEDGYPVKDTDWYTIFSFNERAQDGLANLQAGSQLLVDGKSIFDSRRLAADSAARITTTKSDVNGTQVTNTNFQETARRVLQSPRKADA